MLLNLGIAKRPIAIATEGAVSTFDSPASKPHHPTSTRSIDYTRPPAAGLYTSRDGRTPTQLTTEVTLTHQIMFKVGCKVNRRVGVLSVRRVQRSYLFKFRDRVTLDGLEKIHYKKDSCDQGQKESLALGLQNPEN